MDHLSDSCPTSPNIDIQDLRNAILSEATFGQEEYVVQGPEPEVRGATYRPAGKTINTIRFYGGIGENTIEGFVAQLAIHFGSGKQRHLFVDEGEEIIMKDVSPKGRVEVPRLVDEFEAARLFHGLGEAIASCTPHSRRLAIWQSPHTPALVA